MGVIERKVQGMNKIRGGFLLLKRGGETDENNNEEI
jgi:hypothetical protein